MHRLLDVLSGMGSVLVILLGTSGVAGAFPLLQVPAGGSELTWRVSGGEEALRQAVSVRFIIRNRIPPSEIRPDLGIVQSASYFFSSSSKGAALFTGAAARLGLQVVQADAELVLANESLRVTAEPQDVSREDYVVGLVLGRSLRVLGPTEQAGETGRNPGALRAESVELNDRKHWSPETLIPAGEERLVWEGRLPLDVDRIYVSYLVIRSDRNSRFRDPSRPDVRRRLDQPDGGILELPITATEPHGAARSTGSGFIVGQSTRDRIHPIKLVPGGLNVIRAVAVLDGIGALKVEIHQEMAQVQR